MNIFTKHPQSIGETYWQHLCAAMTFGGKMIIAGLGCVIHAIFPFIFSKTASNANLNLTQRFLKRLPSNPNQNLTHVISALERIEKMNRNS